MTIVKKTLNARHNELASPEFQMEVLEHRAVFIPFSERIKAHGFDPLRAAGISTLQVNVGKMCNQTCAHCHVDAGPDRQEIMSPLIMQQCLDVLKHSDIHTVDITGGAPEL